MKKTILTFILLVTIYANAWFNEDLIYSIKNRFLTEQKFPKLQSSFEFENAAVASIVSGFTENPAIIITTFKPFQNDGIYLFKDAKEIKNSQTAPQFETLNQNIKWPNQAEQIDQNKQLIVSGGFFITPAKSTGSVNIIDYSSYPQIKVKQISTDKKANFYHHSESQDVNKDGRNDFVAARAYKSMNPFDKAQGQLLWLEAPLNDDGKWIEHILAEGPDVDFITVDIDGDGQFEVIAAQFFTIQQLAVYYCPVEWVLCGDDKTKVEVYLIDSAEQHSYFNLQWVDLNNDGKKDILASTNANGGGRILSFQLNGDFKQGSIAWTKIPLADGYIPKSRIQPGAGSPGTVRAFQPTTQTENIPKPFICVSADDGGWVDILIPDSQIQSDWNYTKNRLLTSKKGTVGSFAIGDLDNTGNVEIVVPLYADGQVQIFSFDK